MPEGSSSDAPVISPGPSDLISRPKLNGWRGFGAVASSGLCAGCSGFGWCAMPGSTSLIAFGSRRGTCTQLMPEASGIVAVVLGVRKQEPAIHEPDAGVWIAYCAT